MFRLIVGLGNPGAEYHYTRHSLGRLALEAVADYYGAAWQEDKKWQAKLAAIAVGGEEIALMCPSVFMNNSGVAVGAWAHFYQVLPSQIVLFHDELDLASFEIRSKIAGGLNGHNGLRSVASSLEDRRDFARIRLGIGRPIQENRDITSYVLSKLSSSDLTIWRRQFEILIAKLPDWLSSGGQEEIAIKA